MRKESDGLDLDKRKGIVEAIKTPLGFCALTMLIVEPVILEILITPNNFYKEILIYGVLGIAALVIILVIVTAIWKPEALLGKQYRDLDESFIEKLAEDMYTALDPYLANLGEDERTDAYKLLEQTIISSSSTESRRSKKFRAILSEKIIRRADLQDKWRKTKIKDRSAVSNRTD